MVKMCLSNWAPAMNDQAWLSSCCVVIQIHHHKQLDRGRGKAQPLNRHCVTNAHERGATCPHLNLRSIPYCTGTTPVLQFARSGMVLTRWMSCYALLHSFWYWRSLQRYLASEPVAHRSPSSPNSFSSSFFSSSW